MLIKKYECKIKGISPIIIHSDKLCDPCCQAAIQMKEISSIRKKTIEHHLAMSALEWRAALYENSQGKVYIPSENIQACILGAARKFKLGKSMSAVIVTNSPGPLLEPYEKFFVDQLWEKRWPSGDREHLYAKSVCIQKARIMRSRPIFNEWGLTFEISLNTEILSQKELENILITAGMQQGLGDRRPANSGHFGMFTIEKFKEI